MKIAVIGLGRMGAAIAQRAAQAGYCVLGYDPNVKAEENSLHTGIQVYSSLTAVAQEADVVWLMVPAGAIVDTVLAQIVPVVKKDAIIVDGGNSKFTESVRRAQELRLQGISYLDCGTSGGVHGLYNGFCLMVGGDYTTYERLEPVLMVLAVPQGYGYMGPSGAGHYVKMIHNGIEYGLLQAYAEGFQLLKEGSYKDLDLQKIAAVWQHGSVIRSWLLALAEDIFKQDQTLTSISGVIEEGGTGAWTVENAHENKVPVPVIEQSLHVRRWSQQTGGNFATKVIQLLRNAFGGHRIVRK